MKFKQIITFIVIIISFTITSCKGKENKSEATDTPETSVTNTAPDDGMVPVIDTTNLKDEASLLAAIQKVADARNANDKKQKEDPNYSGHYLELTKLYTAVLKASNAYSETIKDPQKALEFHDKFGKIQNTMYE